MTTQLLCIKYILSVVFFAVCCLTSLQRAEAQSTPTKVMVRAVSQDAKVLQDAVGGARITIRNVSTGEVLAEGVQTGSSGSTDRIMKQPHVRDSVLYDTPGTAGYLATLTLEHPTVVEITAEGPLGSPQAIQRASKTMLLVPGQDVLGDGVILTIHGFIVDIVSPEQAVAAPGQPMEVRATTVMACGCPTEPGGLWNSDTIEIVARLVKDGRVLAEAPMQYAGERSTYTVSLPVPSEVPDGLTLEVLAMDPAHANFGRDQVEVNVQR